MAATDNLMSPNNAMAMPTPGVDVGQLRRRDSFAAASAQNNSMALARSVLIERSYYDASSWRGPDGIIPELANFSEGVNYSHAR